MFCHVAQPEILLDRGVCSRVHVDLGGHFEGVGVRWGFCDLDEAFEPVVVEPST